MQNSRSLFQSVIVLVVVIALGFVAYSVLTRPDHRSTTERISDAVHELPNGIGAASREMEDRTPGQKIGDAIKDGGEKVKENTAN